MRRMDYSLQLETDSSCLFFDTLGHFISMIIMNAHREQLLTKSVFFMNNYEKTDFLMFPNFCSLKKKVWRANQGTRKRSTDTVSYVDLR